MGTTEEALQEPPDRFRAALLILYLQGMGTLLPWYALITKVDYYQLIFRGSAYASSFASSRRPRRRRAAAAYGNRGTRPADVNDNRTGARAAARLTARSEGLCTIYAPRAERRA